MAEDNAQDALDRSIDEMRVGVAQAPQYHVKDRVIREYLITRHRYDFSEKFETNFKKDKDKWARDRDKALQMARYIGLLAMFHAEAHKKTEIDNESLEYGMTEVAKHCKLRAAEEKANNALGPQEKLDVWCS